MYWEKETLSADNQETNNTTDNVRATQTKTSTKAGTNVIKLVSQILQSETLKLKTLKKSLPFDLSSYCSF